MNKEREPVSLKELLATSTLLEYEFLCQVLVGLIQARITWKRYIPVVRSEMDAMVVRLPALYERGGNPARPLNQAQQHALRRLVLNILHLAYGLGVRQSQDGSSNQVDAILHGLEQLNFHGELLCGDSVVQWIQEFEREINDPSVVKEHMLPLNQLAMKTNPKAIEGYKRFVAKVAELILCTLQENARSEEEETCAQVL